MMMNTNVKMVLSMASLAVIYAAFSNLVPNLSEIAFFVAITMGLAEYLSRGDKQYLTCKGEKCGEKIELPDDMSLDKGLSIQCPKCKKYNVIFVGVSEENIKMEKNPVVD